MFFGSSKKLITFKLANKEFLKTNYPRGRAIEVFCSFYFDLLGQNSKFYYLDSRLHENDNFRGYLEAEHRGILFD